MDLSPGRNVQQGARGDGTGGMCDGQQAAGGGRTQYEDGQSTHHRSVEVRFPLCCGGEERELRDAEDLAVDVLDVLLPHRTRPIIGEDFE